MRVWTKNEESLLGPYSACTETSRKPHSDPLLWMDVLEKNITKSSCYVSTYMAEYPTWFSNDFKPCLFSSGVLVFRFRGKKCRVRRRRKYTIKLRGVRARIARFRKRLRMRIGRKWCRIKRKARRWRVRIRRRWCRLKKRGRRWFYKKRLRWKRLRRVRVTIRIKRKRCRVRRRRGRWLLKYKRKWRKIKRKTLGFFRFKGRRKFVRLIGRKKIVYKRRRYRIKTKIIRRRRREYTELKAVVNYVFYHMTRTAPRAISLENHKKKGPV